MDPGWGSPMSVERAESRQMTNPQSGSARSTEETPPAPPMRILLLNQTFHPDVAATAQHGWDLARYLSEQGHDVVAVASRSIYGQSGAALPKRETIDHIEIHRVGSAIFGKSAGTFGRLIDFALWYVLAAWRVLTLRRCDVCIAFTTPPFVALIGLLLRGLRGTRLIYWVMDLYPDVPILYGMMRPTSPTARVLERLNRGLLRRADRSVVLGRCMRDRVIAKGIADERLVTIPVWADRHEIVPAATRSPELREQWGISGRKVVMYSGNFGLMHEAQTILEAARRLAMRPDIIFLLVGSGQRLEEAKRFAAEHGLSNLLFKPYQPRERLNDLLTLPEVHLASMIEGAEGLIVPSKLFGILAAGRPVVFVGPASSEIARIIDEEEAGAVTPVGDPEGLAAVISRLVDDPAEADQLGANGRRALEERYDRAIACRRFLQVIESVRQEQRQASPGKSAGAASRQGV